MTCSSKPKCLWLRLVQFGVATLWCVGTVSDWHGPYIFLSSVFNVKSLSLLLFSTTLCGQSDIFHRSLTSVDSFSYTSLVSFVRAHLPLSPARLALKCRKKGPVLTFIRTLYAKTLSGVAHCGLSAQSSQKLTSEICTWDESKGTFLLGVEGPVSQWVLVCV